MPSQKIEVIVHPLDTLNASPGHKYHIDAPAISIVELDDANANAQIRVNSVDAEPIDLSKGMEIEGGITDIWVSNDAGSGRVVIVVWSGICVSLLGGGGGGGVFEGLFQAAPTAVADGETKQILIDENGRLRVLNEGALTPGEDTVSVASATPGTHGNAWDAAAVAIGGNSAIINIAGGGVISIFGNVDAATDLDVYYSQDGVNFYQSSHQISLAGAGDFGADFRIAAAFIRLQSSAAATITATVAEKP